MTGSRTMIPLTPLEPWIGRKTGCERLSRPAIEAYQLQKLNETIALARRKSPFYRRHLAGAPQSLESLADLHRFPFTTADDLQNSPLQFLCVSQGEIQRVVTLQTSATTGAAKRLFFTRADQELTIDFFHHGMATFTRPGDRVLIGLPGERPGSVGDLLAIALRRLGAKPLIYGPVRDPAEALDYLHRHRPQVVVGIPTHLLLLARMGQNDDPPPAPREVLLSTDYVPKAIVAALEGTWGCRVYNHYGMTEMGLGGGVECQARTGYHLREADLYFEVIEPETGQPAGPGETGEIVFTTLTREGMPLIRYRTGDLSHWIPDACPCGTVLHTLAKVRLRRLGRIPLAAGVLTMADLDEALFPLPGLVDFTAALSREGDMDVLELEAQFVKETARQDHRAIEDRLHSIQAIAASCRAGGLKLQVSAQTWKPPAAAVPGKRRILDHRPGPGG